MTGWRYPLGIDIGTTRVRVVAFEHSVRGPRLAAVAVRETGEGCATSGEVAQPAYICAVLEQALGELGVRERRCVCALGEPEATLRSVRFPRMSGGERMRAARFEAGRYVDLRSREHVVRLHPLDPREQLYALGVARAAAVATRSAALKAAGLKTLAVDHDACAFGRLFPGYDAIVDVGHERTNVHVYSGPVPLTMHVTSGGAEVTRAIGRELAVDLHSAERRKRILGTLGAGAQAREHLCTQVAALIASLRARAVNVMRIGLVGNGARLQGLATDLEEVTGASVHMAVAQTLRDGAYPDDVVRAGAADWSLAAGLALWQPTA